MYTVGHVAHRDTQDGTWYIQTLSKVFMEDSQKRPVSHLFSKVCSVDFKVNLLYVLFL